MAENFKKVKCCNVCGKMRPLSQMGDGIRIPRTTCLDCYRHRQEANAREKGIEPSAAKVKATDPVIEYLSTL